MKSACLRAALARYPPLAYNIPLAQKPRIKESLPKELKRWRRAQRFSQSKAALRLKVSVKTLQNWEQGQRAPAGFALEQLREKIR